MSPRAASGWRPRTVVVVVDPEASVVVIVLELDEVAEEVGLTAD